MDIEKRFPCVADMEAVARRRMPGFVRDYVTEGIGRGASLRRNRESLDEVILMPRYMEAAGNPQIACELFGRRYEAPFGVAPLGLAGLVWPNAEKILAAAANEHNIPFTLSTVATADPETIGPIAGENGWFQLYTPLEPEVLEDLLIRCQRSGFGTLLVTVDVPAKTRRDHDIRNGLSVPPTFDLKTLWQMVTHPQWALRMLFAGVPQFATVTPYYKFYGVVPARSVGQSIRASARFIRIRMGGHITAERFSQIRDLWPGNLLVKGILHPEEAQAYLGLGADGIVVSNHGGRQLDAAPSAAMILPRIRKAVGPDATILADGGVRSGLDVARMLALGADFVLLGRAFLYAVAALDRRGGDHVINILQAELRSTMGQLGCPTLADLPKTLVSQDAAMNKSDR